MFPKTSRAFCRSQTLLQEAECARLLRPVRLLLMWRILYCQQYFFITKHTHRWNASAPQSKDTCIILRTLKWCETEKWVTEWFVLERGWKLGHWMQRRQEGGCFWELLRAVAGLTIGPYREKREGASRTEREDPILLGISHVVGSWSIILRRTPQDTRGHGECSIPNMKGFQKCTENAKEERHQFCSFTYSANVKNSAGLSIRAMWSQLMKLQLILRALEDTSDPRGERGIDPFNAHAFSCATFCTALQAWKAIHPLCCLLNTSRQNTTNVLLTILHLWSFIRFIRWNLCNLARCCSIMLGYMLI